MNTTADTSQKVDADHLALRAQPRPVTRLNRRTLALAVGVLAAALLGATVWSLQAQRRPTQAAPDLHISDKVAQPENLAKLAQDYTQVPVLGEPKPGDWGIVQARHEAQADASARPANRRADPARRRRQQDIDPVAAAPLLFKTGSGSANKAADRAGTAAPPAPVLPNVFGALAPNIPTDPTVLQNQQGHKEGFLAEGGSTTTRSSGTLQPPPSPWAVMAGTVIAAALVTGINSDLPGKIIATVTEPIYDSATGRTLLIPQGSRLLGEYDSQVAFGQRRVLVVWTRLVLPDTSSITLDRLPAVDAAGYAGLEDGVDWHWGRVFAGAAVSTLIGVGAELAAPDNQGSDGRVVIAARDSVQDSVNQVGQEITRRNLSVQPTLTERPGLRLRVIVNKDLLLRPYQPLIYGRNAP
jgi:type IV secretion system protein VirB10